MLVLAKGALGGVTAAAAAPPPDVNGLSALSPPTPPAPLPPPSPGEAALPEPKGLALVDAAPNGLLSGAAVADAAGAKGFVVGTSSPAPSTSNGLGAGSPPGCEAVTAGGGNMPPLKMALPVNVAPNGPGGVFGGRLSCGGTSKCFGGSGLGGVRLAALPRVRFVSRPESRLRLWVLDGAEGGASKRAHRHHKHPHALP